MQVDRYAGVMVACARALLDTTWVKDRGGVRDVYADFNGLAFAITLTALFGADVATSVQVRGLPSPDVRHTPPARTTGVCTTDRQPLNSSVPGQPESASMLNILGYQFGTGWLSSQTNSQDKQVLAGMHSRSVLLHTSLRQCLRQQERPPACPRMRRHVSHTLQLYWVRSAAAPPRCHHGPRYPLPTSLATAEQSCLMQGRVLTESIRTAFEHFTERAATGFVVPEWLPTPSNLQYNGAVSRLDTYVYSLIRQRRAELGLEIEGGTTVAPSTPPSSGSLGREAPVATSTRTDLLTALVLSTDDDGSRMDDGHLRDELMTLLVAGQETSAILLAWLCAALAWHPQVQEKAAAEVQVGCGHCCCHLSPLVPPLMTACCSHL